MVSRSLSIRWCLPLICCTIIAAGCGVNQAPGQAAATPVVLPSAVPVATPGKPTLVPAPIKPTIEPVASVVPETPEQAVIAPCTFPLPQSAAAAIDPVVPPLDAYSFGEPTIVYRGIAIGIAVWLPDNQHVLITRGDATVQKGVVELLNVQQQTAERLAIRDRLGTKPLWLNNAQMAVFTDANSNNQVVLRTARGQGLPPDDIAIDLQSPYITVNVIGDKVLFAPQKNIGGLQVVNLIQAQRMPESVVTAAQFESVHQQLDPPQQTSKRPGFMQSSWSPTDRFVVLYNEMGIYIQDLVARKTCKLALRIVDGEAIWATTVSWSPDGRYIALLVVTGNGPPFQKQQLRIIDTTTGQQTTTNVGALFVFEATWAPNGRQLLALAQTGQEPDKHMSVGLFLISAETLQYRQLFPDFGFDAGLYSLGEGGVAWSPDGQQVVVKCPIFSPPPQQLMLEDRICLMTVAH